MFCTYLKVFNKRFKKYSFGFISMHALRKRISTLYKKTNMKMLIANIFAIVKKHLVSLRKIFTNKLHLLEEAFLTSTTPYLSLVYYYTLLFFVWV